jgi:DNA gyrase subunit B
MPEVIANGYLYICQPPLYRVSTGKVTRYATSEKERDAAEADEIFSTLMGERVEPRRDFIRGEARKVRNLDI